MSDAQAPAEPASAAQPSAGQSRVLKLRYTPTSLVALGFATICALPLIIAAYPWGLVALLLPALVVVYVLRTGADITPEQIVIRGPFYSRPIPLTEVGGLAVSAKRGVFLVKNDGSSILIPTARPRDLPRLRELLFPDAAAEPAEEDPATDASVQDDAADQDPATQ